MIVNEDSIVVLEIARMGGVFGLVSVAWEISGSHGDGEITPSQGTVSDYTQSFFIHLKVLATNF